MMKSVLNWSHAFRFLAVLRHTLHSSGNIPIFYNYHVCITHNLLVCEWYFSLFCKLYHIFNFLEQGFNGYIYIVLGFYYFISEVWIHDLCMGRVEVGENLEGGSIGKTDMVVGNGGDKHVIDI